LLFILGMLDLFENEPNIAKILRRTDLINFNPCF